MEWRRLTITVALATAVVAGISVYAERDNANLQLNQTGKSKAKTAGTALPLQVHGNPMADRRRHSPLPSDAPLASTFDTLKHQADIGDANAACRLAVELIECRDLPLRPGSSGQPGDGSDAETEFALQGNLGAANNMAQMKVNVLLAREHCEGINASQILLAPTYLHQAALAGVPDAMLRFADAMAFDPMKGFGMFRNPVFDAWRREAPGMMERRLEQGDLRAITPMFAAYTSDSSPLAGLVPDDPARGYALELLLARIHGHVARQPNQLRPEQIRWAQAEASRMHRDYFHDRVLGNDEQIPGYGPAWSEQHDASSKPVCE